MISLPLPQSTVGLSYQVRLNFDLQVERGLWEKYKLQ